MAVTVNNKGSKMQGIRRVGFVLLAIFLLVLLLFQHQSGADQCPRGYHSVDGKCVPVIIPPNAELNVFGNGWVCRFGYKKIGGQCLPMTDKEIKQQQEQMQKMKEEIRKRRILVRTPCEAAYRRCINECENADIYDYEKGKYIHIRNTDYLDNCEDACRRGKRYCEDEERDERCYEFKRACRNDCPSDIFSYGRGEYLLNTDANDQCDSVRMPVEQERENANLGNK